MDRAETIITFIREELLEDAGEVIAIDTSLFEERLLDSLSIVSLITFLEKTFDIKITPSEVTVDNLDTVGNILRMLEAKMSQ